MAAHRSYPLTAMDDRERWLVKEYPELARFSDDWELDMREMAQCHFVLTCKTRDGRFQFQAYEPGCDPRKVVEAALPRLAESQAWLDAERRARPPPPEPAVSPQLELFEPSPTPKP